MAGTSDAAVTLGVPLRVSPAAGHPRSTFRLQYVTPERSGVEATTDLVTLTGPSRVGCVSSESVHEQVLTPGAQVLVRLRPTGGRPWCVGTFRGEVEETVRPRCAAGQMCPMFIALLPVGHFRFVVRH